MRETRHRAVQAVALIGSERTEGATRAVMSAPIRGLYCIYVVGSLMARNVAEGLYEPVISVMDMATNTTRVVRDVWWNGPTRFVNRSIPLPGTAVHAWVETDATLTLFQDGDGFSSIAPRGRRDPGYPPSVMGDQVVHLDVPTVRRNRANKTRDPEIAVRHSASMDRPLFVREAMWDGPSVIRHRLPTAIPGTNGRGTAYVEVDAEITAITDGLPPFVLVA